jgi:hypothetical protein
MAVAYFLAAFLVAVAAPPQPAKKLAVAGIAVHQFDGGPALPSSYTFVPGETVSFTFNVEGFTASENGQIKLSYTARPVDRQDVALVAPFTGKLDAELAPEDKNWRPNARHDFVLPSYLDSGTYRLVVSVKDELAGAEATAEASIRVRGRAVEPAATVTARNFRFLRSEEDGAALAAPVYRPADTVWARFEITGYKLGVKNRFQVDYGLAVVSPSGKVLFSQPQAATEQEQPVYPRRWVPGVLSLTGRADTKPGEYTLVLTVRDLVGNQTSESRHHFRVE